VLLQRLNLLAAFASQTATTRSIRDVHVDQVVVSRLRTAEITVE